MYDDNFINLLKSNQIVVPLAHGYEDYKHSLFSKDYIQYQLSSGATIKPVITKIISRQVPNLGEYIWEGGNTIRKSYSGQLENVVDDIIDPITVQIFDKNTHSLVCKNIELANNKGSMYGRLYLQCIDDKQVYDLTGYTENNNIVAVVVKFEAEDVSGPKYKGNGKPRNKPKKGIKASTLMLLMHMMNQNKKG